MTTSEVTRAVRLLVVGDAVASTGFARVTRAVLERLRDRYEIHQLGINFDGDPHPLSWNVYPARVGGDIHGVGRLASLVETIRPDIVWMVNDPWVIADYATVLERVSHRSLSVAYISVDSGPVDPEIAVRMSSLDRWVAFTSFGQRMLSDAVPATTMAGERPASAACPIPVIPLGVEREVFQPRELSDLLDRSAAKRELFPRSDQFVEPTFVVLNANRNQPRKRIDLTMEAFAIFARGKPPGVKLYLHMGVEDLGWNLPLLASRLGIERRLILTHGMSGPPQETSARLNLIYNACDVGINTATGEGWGLVAFEHAATGAPQVMPRHTSLEELWEGAGVLVEPSFRLTNERIHTEAYLVSPARVADELERLYGDDAYRREMASAAYRRACDARFSWNAIAGQWHELFQTLRRENRPGLRQSGANGAY